MAESLFNLKKKLRKDDSKSQGGALSLYFIDILDILVSMSDPSNMSYNNTFVIIVSGHVVPLLNMFRSHGLFALT